MTFGSTSSIEAGLAKAPSGTLVLPTTWLRAAAWRLEAKLGVRTAAEAVARALRESA